MRAVSMSPQAERRGRVSGAVCEAFVERAIREGVMSGGHHNRNFLLPLDEAMAREIGADAGTTVTVRVRKPADEAPTVVARTWHDEVRVLDAVGSALPHVPTCLAETWGASVHSYVDGVPLSRVCPEGRPVDQALIGRLTGLLAEMSRVDAQSLPPLPDHWPCDGDSRGFLHTLAKLVHHDVCLPNWPKFGSLFTALRVPVDAMERYAERVPRLTPRPYGLLHADLHRDNVILAYSGEPPLICVDWELATYGDPLHDLAVHLVRMRYPDAQWEAVVKEWEKAVQAVTAASAQGLAADLGHYLAFERAQSVYPDVMRAALSLDGAFEQHDLDRATESIRQALTAAARPLRLDDVPTGAEVEDALVAWLKLRGARHAKLRPLIAMDWTRRPQRLRGTGEPRAAVVLGEALAAERRASADQVLTGAAHRNTVVCVEAASHPVVVRRRRKGAHGDRQGLLYEHTVLEVIERSGVAVQAPRALGLGMSEGGLLFALHSYVGTAAHVGRLDHPVDGLRPDEADALVDQLCELTKVDEGLLGSFGTRWDNTDFYGLLGGRLVELVAALPVATRELAQELGLPGEEELPEILGSHRVTPRRRTLLHGDLHPWNLVRREGEETPLAMVDWEAAMLGDPLYDLVRHMHLTPTPRKTRKRMFDRWQERLDGEYTRQWRDDESAYLRLERVRSAYVDLDRLVTRSGLDAPEVSRAVDSYAVTLARAKSALGLRGWRRGAEAPPLLLRALPCAERERPDGASCGAHCPPGSRPGCPSACPAGRRGWAMPPVQAVGANNAQEGA
ncbi:aminoglycoside phosphotransferase family protein [Streptomyces sp. MB09-02B]|uniref:phosphotransferase family protein n=1 Tax=Streptomyces sp. MB09-02B TaxID=3028667 RepID=UPI0029AD8B79|nr:aminoglycoside phosphotransferase family protein [Streptomyces sp. MB09-02B]MDX3644164.1 aminoglycoside phosphotransferase family protein [Streptomyces sp. MB09-02B]